MPETVVAELIRCQAQTVSAECIAVVLEIGSKALAIPTLLYLPSNAASIIGVFPGITLFTNFLGDYTVADLAADRCLRESIADKAHP